MNFSGPVNGVGFEIFQRLLPTREGAPEILDAFLLDFQTAWDSGSPPELETVLERAAPDLRPAMAYLLIKEEIERGAQEGRWPRHGQYVRDRFPELTAVLDAGKRASTPDDSFFGRFPSFEELVSAIEQETTFHYPRASGQGLDAFGPRIGRWTVEFVIGRGGMGIVYYARDEEGRPAALKAVHPGLLYFLEDKARGNLLMRFRREGRLACSLPRHRHIVPAIEIGAAQGFFYLAMEYMEKGPFRLDPLLNGDPQSRAERRRTIAGHVLKLARAVEHCHRHGVIHCDLKLSNLFFNADGEPCLADFGLARSIQESRPAAEENASLDLFTFGTPNRSAPEMLSYPATADARTDIYGLGVILHELLIGAPPFSGVSARKTARLVLTDPPEWLSRIDNAGQGIPPDLELICLKCLRKRPSERYATAEELAADLDCFLAGQPIRASRVRERVYRARLALAKHGRKIAAAALLPLAAVPIVASRWHAQTLLRSDPSHIEEHVKPNSWSPKQWPIWWVPRDSQEFSPDLVRAAAGDQAAADRLADWLFFRDPDPSHPTTRSYPEPSAIPAIARILHRVSPGFVDRLVARLGDPNAGAESALRTAAALSSLRPDHPSWPSLAPNAVNALTRIAAEDALSWTAPLAPAADALTKPALEVCRERSDALGVAAALGHWLSDEEEWLRFASEAREAQVGWLIRGRTQYKGALSGDRVEAWVRKLSQQRKSQARPDSVADVGRLSLLRGAANLMLTQWALGDRDAGWRRMIDVEDGDFSLQTEAIHRLFEIEGAEASLLDRLEDGRTSADGLRVAILTLSRKPLREYSTQDQERLRKQLSQLRAHPSAAARNSADWLAERWGLDRTGPIQPPPGANWRLTDEGFLLIRIPKGPILAAQDGGPSAPMSLPSGFEIAAHEVRWGQYRKFLKEKKPSDALPPEAESLLNAGSRKSEDLDRYPALKVSAKDAEAYCEWLTEKERAASPDAAKFVYRLPSHAEWMHVARAGSRTPWFFGESPRWIESWANVLGPSQWADVPESRPAPAGERMPNPWGFFDFLGNAQERCSDPSLWVGGAYNSLPKFAKFDSFAFDLNTRPENGFRIVRVAQ